MNYREEFPSLGRMLGATAAFARNLEDGPDRRLAMQAVAGLGGVTGVSGGFLIPVEHASSIWERVDAVGQILRRCTKQPVSTKHGDLNIPAVDERSRADGSRFGGLNLAWLDQGEPFPQSKPSFGLVKFRAKKLGGVINVTDELLGDTVALDAWFTRVTSRELAFDVEDSIVAGSGVGQPLGLLNAPALITVEKDAAQAAGTISFDNLKAMVKRLWPGSFPTACWLMGNDAFAEILSMWETDGSILSTNSEGERTLLDFPIVLTEATSSLGEIGDIILADLAEYVVVECEAGTGILSSIHVRFVADETAFRVAARVDGAPAWTSPVTVKNSAETVSPFVTLEARN
ncbi:MULTISPECIES: phage major capsid protein [unclassified Afipia]|uniref:phage major capsid protein n=1 Tax=unclassified Afipia TaxID=2642050 RepID=UPI0003FF719D|nr:MULTISPECIES: phage major capsid protein [unclassified Afipia]